MPVLPHPDRLWGPLLPGVKRMGREAGQSPPTIYSAKVKNECSYTSTAPICLLGVVLNKNQEHIYFYFS
jgi:hypothetical protein